MNESRIVGRGRALATISKRSFVVAMVMTLFAGLAAGVSQASHPVDSLPGSNFEIDTDANLTRDDASPSIDWASVSEFRRTDLPTGTTDDSFKASKESEPDPLIENGSIPNNKSDLKAFGIYQETTAANARFLHMFWSRVQDPSGTTNLDFEFNKKACPPDCSANGTTPKRTVGDMLIIYDLDRGGRVPTISLRTWNGSDWSGATDLTAAGMATGSINDSAISAGDADGLGMLDARTFGEATVDLSVIFDSTKCENFGSAYLKSRSSTPITAELKDLIAPAATRIGNCGSIKIKKIDNGAPPHNLAGAEFTLHKDVAPIGGTFNPAVDVAVSPAKKCSTAADGECVITDVFAGTYWVVESKTPAGYETADPQAVTVTADEQRTLTFVDVFIPKARISIAPAAAANQVGDDHVLTVTVSKQGVNDADFVAAAGADVKLSITAGPGSFKNGDDDCTTGASGQCSVTLVSSVTGLTTVSATAAVPVDSKIVIVSTNGQDGSSGPAKKHWVDVRLSLTPPQAANRVDDDHTFTAHLEFDLGSGYVDAPAGKTIGFALVSGPGSLSASSCTTGAGGTCTVDLTSGVTGLSKVEASFDGTVATAEGNAAASASSDDARKQWVDVQLDLTPSSAVNRVGDPHTFTAHLLFDKGDGNGFADAAGETIDFTKSGVGTLSASSCTTGAGGTCSVVLASSVTGSSSVQASWDGDVVTSSGTVSTSETDTASKDWVDALITINPPQDTNEVGDDHTFTITVSKKVNGVTSPAAGVDAKASIISGPGAFVGNDDTCTTDANGGCTVTIRSNTTGLTTVKAEATIVVSGKSITLSTDGAGGNTDPAKKRWVAARLSLTPPEAANQIGDPHTFTAHLEFDEGDGSGWVDAPAGESISVSESGPGTLVSASCTTDTNGTCSIELNSSQTGLSTVTATWDGDVTTSEGTASMATKTDDAVKRWVDARLALTPPQAANQVGDDHTFTAHLEFDTGSGWTDAPAGKVISLSKVSGPGSLSASSCTTNSGGGCTVVLSSPATGLATVEASWNGSIVTAEGTASASAAPDDAVKHWVDARLSLTPPQAANQVGDLHTFTAHLEFDTGSGWADAPAGKTIDVAKVSGPGALSAAGCETDANGECTVDLSSAVTGPTTVEASFDGTVATAEGSAAATAASGDAVKRWVDARLALTPPQAANRVDDAHTFTASLEFDEGDGSGFVAAPAGETIDFAESGPGTLATDSCTTAADGRCTVDLNSTLTGLSTVTASWDGGIVTAEGTAQASAEPEQAVKRWIDVKLDLTPETAVNRIGDTHTFTAHLTFDSGDGNGFVDAGAGRQIGFTSSGVGALSASGCTTDADGTCTVDLESDVTGSSTVTASWNGDVVTSEGTVTTSQSDAAEKHWVDALILINPPQATNEIGDDHVFTISVKQTSGGVTSPAADVDVSASISSGPGSFVGPDDCTTDADGECTVTISSDATGLTTVLAEATVIVNGKSIVVKTDGIGGNAAPATKRWVDARLSVTPPEATNRIGDPHAFTAHLELDKGDGNGFVDGPAGETISWTKPSGPGTFSSDTCVTDASGTCTTTLNSTVPGLTEVHGSWTGDATTAEGSATMSRGATATKLWIAPDILLEKTADPVAGGPRNVTYTYVVTNTGDSTLTDILVTDDILGDIGTIDELEAQASATLERTVAVDENSPTRNIGEACGTDMLGGEVCDTDDADIAVVLAEEIFPPTLPKTGLGLRLWLLWSGALLAAGAAALTLEETIRRRRVEAPIG